MHDYPLKLVQDMPGFFNKTRHRVGGEQLTLDQIETDRLHKLHKLHKLGLPSSIRLVAAK